MTERSLSPLPPPVESTRTLPIVPFHTTHTISHDAVKILRDAILLTEGRDKVVKLIQYTSRLLVLHPSFPSKRLRPLISQLSMTRKVIKLGHGIFPYIELRKGGLGTLTLIREFVEFLNDFWDDVYCLSRIGFLRNAKIQHWSETWANRAWMTGIIMDLHVLLERKKVMRMKLKTVKETKIYLEVGSPQDDDIMVREKLKNEAYWIDVSIAKLLADLSFCCSLPLFCGD